jgi:polyhydroxybutyrate depolymerase
MKSLKICLFILLAIAMLLGTASCSRTAATSTPMPTLAPGGYQRTLMVKGQSRSYLLYVPPNLDNSQPVAVVFGFHGYTGTGQSFRDVTGFNDIAAANGFLVVYPEGEGGDHSWNAGGCCAGARMADLEDVAFIRQVISDLKTIANIDPKRIYATGHSNGAMFVYRLACEMADTFAAIAPVAGPLFYSPCKPKGPVSVMHVHGLADLAVPYTGGPYVGYSSMVFPSVEESIAAWVRLDGCSDEALVDEQGAVTHTAYASCKAGTAVELYAIEGLGHIWPQPDVWPASETIWEFFAAHPKP